MSVTIDYTKGFFEPSPVAEKVGTITGTTLDLTSGNVFSYTPTADTTFVFSNPPTTGTALGFTLGLTGADVSASYDIANAEPPVYGYFSVAAQETAPTGVFFKPDGLKMYVIGYLGDDVNEYDLSTAWDISTASYLQNFSIAAQETSPQGIFFKPDGTKMYIIGQSGDAVWQYSTGFVGDATFTYPASVEWAAGTPPTSPADGDTDLLTFLTQDGGTTYYGRLIGDNFS